MGRADYRPMRYEDLFERHDLALLYDWLEESGDLYVDLDRLNCGALNNSIHFVDGLAELKAVVSHETFPQVCISIFREKQYPIRGPVDDSLMAIALEQIPDHQWFSIVSLGTGLPAPFDVIGYGDCREELREELTSLKIGRAHV